MLCLNVTYFAELHIESKIYEGTLNAGWVCFLVSHK